MEYGIESEIGSMARTGEPLQVLFQIPVPDLGEDIKITAILVDMDLIVIIAIDEGSIGEQPLVEKMVPSQRGRGIPPVDPNSVGLAENFSVCRSRVNQWTPSLC